MKSAKSEQKFNIDRTWDLSKGIDRLKSTILWQEKVIRTLENQIGEKLNEQDLNTIEREKELLLKKQTLMSENKILKYFREKVKDCHPDNKFSLYKEYERYFSKGLFSEGEIKEKMENRKKALELEEEIKQLGHRLEKKEWKREMEKEAKENDKNYNNLNPNQKILLGRKTNKKNTGGFYELPTNYYRREILYYKELITSLENKIRLKHKSN